MMLVQGCSISAWRSRSTVAWGTVLFRLDLRGHECGVAKGLRKLPGNATQSPSPSLSYLYMAVVYDASLGIVSSHLLWITSIGALMT